MIQEYFRQELIELTPYTPGEQPSVTSKITKLNTNENPYPPSPETVLAGREILEQGYLRKYPNPTSEELRKTIARVYGISPDQILVTNGSDEAIRILFAACLNTGDRVLCPEPTYSAYPVFADASLEKIQFAKIPLLGNLQFDWETMKSTSAKLCAFANPNAPTGCLESRDKILDFVRGFAGLVLCDEAYVDFAPEGSTLIGDTINNPNLFVSRTFSKSYGLAGLRVGFLVGHPDRIATLHKIKDSYNVGMLDQAIAQSALTDQEYFRRNRDRVVNTRERFARELEGLGFTVVPSHTNFVFAKPPAGHPALKLFGALKEEGIYVRYFASGISAQYLRISIGTEEDMDYVANVLGKLLA